MKTNYTLDHLFPNLEQDFNELMESANRVISSHKAVRPQEPKTFKALIGWEIADGQFMWDMSKRFHTRKEADRWVDSLLSVGTFDAGRVERCEEEQSNTL